MCYNVYQVTCSVDGQDHNSSKHQRIVMNKTVSKDKNTSLEVFKSNLSATGLSTTLSGPYIITFHAKLLSTVAPFFNVPVDVTWSEQSGMPPTTGR